MSTLPQSLTECQSPVPIVLPAAPTCWADLVRLEPRLKFVENAARHGGSIWDWGRIKASFSLLVGFGSKRPDLATPLAYDLAYDHLLELFARKADATF